MISPAGKTVVRAEKLSRRYLSPVQPVEALREVDLTVEEGELLGISGSSGSGKSTLLHILGCLDRPTSGTYRFDGRDVGACSDRDLSRLRATRMGFIFQTFNLIPQLSLIDNVLLPYLYRSEPKSVARERAEESVRQVGLWERRLHRPAELSGGEMQRAAIARALAARPVLILADEPTGNLDTDTARSILDLLTELNGRGITILVVSHSREVIDRCRRVIVLRDGKALRP